MLWVNPKILNWKNDILHSLANLQKKDLIFLRKNCIFVKLYKSTKQFFNVTKISYRYPELEREKFFIPIPTATSYDLLKRCQGDHC